MKTDLTLQKDVQKEILWTPSLRAAEIGVAAKNGIVTLSGIVDSYSKKLAAEEAAKRVSGVQGVAVEILVEVGASEKKSDADIAAAAVNALQWNIDVPDTLIKVKVENGWITLSGTVNWAYQRMAAKDSIKLLSGVNGVWDDMLVKPDSSDLVERAEVINALERNVFTDGAGILVDVEGNKVILTGEVERWYDRDEAGRVAWSAPGVISVDNKITVDFDD